MKLRFWSSHSERDCKVKSLKYIGVITCITFCAQLGQCQAPPTDKAVTIPFKLLPSRHMLLEVMINDKGPYKLIFDTGAPINLLNNRLAKDAGILKKGGGGFSLFGGLNQIDVAKMQVGGITAEKLPAIVMDHPTVKAISDMFSDDYGPIEGIVGFPFFGRYSSTVDYQKKQLILKPTDYKPGDYIQDLTKNLMSAGEKSTEPKIVGAAGFWGMAIREDTADGATTVIVRKVYENSPASQAGLQPDDRIITIDGRWTDTLGDTYLATSLVKPGRTVDVVVERANKKLTLKMTPTKGF